MQSVQELAESAGDSLEVACSLLWTLDTNRLKHSVDYTLTSRCRPEHDDQDDDVDVEDDDTLVHSLSDHVWSRPTYASFRRLLQYYTQDAGAPHCVSHDQRAEQWAFLAAICETRCVQFAHQWLSTNSSLHAHSIEHFQHLLHGLWFRLHRRHCSDMSAFQHVFIGELDDGKVKGLHNFYQVYLEELRGNFKYLTYLDPSGSPSSSPPPASQQFITIQFKWLGETQPPSSMFVGASPEFEIALYTMMFLADEQSLELQLGPYSARIKVHDIGRCIGSAFPELIDVDQEALARIDEFENANDAQDIPQPEDYSSPDEHVYPSQNSWCHYARSQPEYCYRRQGNTLPTSRWTESYTDRESDLGNRFNQRVTVYEPVTEWPQALSGWPQAGEGTVRKQSRKWPQPGEKPLVQPEQEPENVSRPTETDPDVEVEVWDDDLEDDELEVEQVWSHEEESQIESVWEPETNLNTNITCISVEDALYKVGESLEDAVSVLWDLDVNRLSPNTDYELNFQSRSDHHGDVAAENLVSRLSENIWERPTFRSLKKLLDNYTAETGIPEVVSQEERVEESTFLDAICETTIAQFAVEWLANYSDCGVENMDDFRALLRSIWFELYDRDGSRDSSGFEHVFIGELADGHVKGLHNFFQVYLEEVRDNFNYKGYLNIRGSNRHELPPYNQQVITIRFEWLGESKSASSMFIGASPEFEIVLYTMLFVSGVESLKVQMGPYSIRVRVHQHDGKLTAAYPDLREIDVPMLIGMQ